MAKGGRSLEETPTWAVALVCFVLVAISIVIEHIFHVIGKVRLLFLASKEVLVEKPQSLRGSLLVVTNAFDACL